ncbi:MAG: polysaccharide biosynthesis protein [Gemmatimonadales bacterium]
MRFENARVLITGGTGSLGRTVIRRLLKGDHALPKRIVVFSRDEAKQYQMRMAYARRRVATEDLVYQKAHELLEFIVGDIRDANTVAAVLRDIDIVINAAALKQVPTCEYFPFEAVRTNIGGAENIVAALREHELPVHTVVGISTDKACKPVNVMGMTKAIQERLLIQANLSCPGTRFVCVRYGNVLASRGSVIPLFHSQIAAGGPVTVTTSDMTRFLLSLDEAVTLVFDAVERAKPGETFVPAVPAARVVDVAAALIGERKIKIKFTGIRPGEKIHEIMVSEDECHRTVKEDGGRFAILPVVPELRPDLAGRTPLTKEYSSGDWLLDQKEVRDLLAQNQLLTPTEQSPDEGYV